MHRAVILVFFASASGSDLLGKKFRGFTRFVRTGSSKKPTPPQVMVREVTTSGGVSSSMLNGDEEMEMAEVVLSKEDISRLLKKLSVGKAPVFLEEGTVQTPLTVEEENEFPDELAEELAEVPSEMRFARVDSGLHQYLMTRQELDVSEALTAPRSLENTCERNALGGVICPAHKIASSAMSSVFHVERNPDLVIKYQSDCNEQLVMEGHAQYAAKMEAWEMVGLASMLQLVEPESAWTVHPLLKEHFFLSQVASLRISPKVRFVSAPAPHPAFHSRKIAFRLSMKEMQSCSKNEAQIRYLVMDKTGPSLHQHSADRGGQVSLVEAVRFGIHMISIIRTLHDQGGIVHGDVHLGNFALRRGGLHLIDYGSAYKLAMDDVDQIHPPMEYVHALLSPWEILGFRPSRRDDVFRTIQTVAYLYRGYEFSSLLSGLEKSDPEMLMRIKLEQNFFAQNQSTIQPGSVMDTLGRVINVARQPGINDRPDYEQILSLFADVVNSLTRKERK